MGFYFDSSGQRIHRLQLDDLEREDVESLRPSPGKSSPTHGGSALRGIPGKIALTARLAQRIDRYARDDRSATPDERTREIVAEALGSTGQPLPAGLRRELEAHAGADLAEVRVHTGAASDRAAQAINAEAFTVGQDIHFVAGTYDPDSTNGQKLIAHEVAHVIQQRSQPKVALEQTAISEPGQAHERHADEFAGLFERSESRPRELDGYLPDAMRTRMERVIAPAEQYKKGAPSEPPQRIPATVPEHGSAPVQKKSAGQENDEEISQMLPSGSGQPIPEDVRAKMERALGVDFSAVRIHEGSQAPAMGALAYTQGTDIHFAPGQYDPGSQRGQELLGHELTHVVQQSQGRVSTTTQVRGVNINDDVILEQEADERGARAAWGNGMPMAGPSSQHQPSQTSTPIQAKSSTAPIQMAKYSDPKNASISAIMASANITDFGPYEWDDTNAQAPMFKLKASFVPTIADCVNQAIYEPEDPAKAVANEKGKQALVSNRRKKALQAIFGKAQGVCEKIMEENGGTAPRAFVSLAQEDSYGGGHSDERHILGRGLMSGHREVALRAAFQKVNGVLMVLDAAGTASVFASETEATTAVTTALNDLTINWATHRKTLAKGTQVKITAAVPSACVAYTKRDAPPGTAYPDTEMPKYIDPAQSGDRELYSGDYVGAGKPTDANAPDTSKPTLTKGGDVTYNQIFIIVDPNPNVTGGWSVYTAYPKP